MNLKATFDKAANLAPIAKTWIGQLEARFVEEGIEVSVKTATDGAASLIAAPALVAKLIKVEGLPTDRPLNVLLVADDPLAVMDEGIWLSYVAEFAGTDAISFYSTCTQVIRSNLYDAGSRLGLRGYTSISLEQAQDRLWDLVICFHPSLENDETGSMAEDIAALAYNGSPVYACMYNEVDALVQSYGLCSHNYEFAWLNGSISDTPFSRDTINPFGYATADVGIEGGWGAVLTKVAPATFGERPADWETIKTAMALYRLDGATSGPWPFGSTVAGVAFNKVQPIALMGNLLVEPKSGVLFRECMTTKVLMGIGRISHSLLEQMPRDNVNLLPWAAEVFLLSTNSLSKEDKRRAESVEVLETAYRNGLIPAGIALARGLEGHGSEKGKERARQHYHEIGANHPSSCYYLGHLAYELDFLMEAMEWFSKAAYTYKFTPAMTDLGAVLAHLGHKSEALTQFRNAYELGDDQGAYELGIAQYEHGEPLLAIKTLREAWSVGNKQALEAADWIVQQVQFTGVGDVGKMRREQKDISFAKKKHEDLLRKVASAS